MCSNYRPVTRADRLLTFFGVERERDEPPVDIFPLGLAPIIRLARDGSGRKLCDDGVFGLLPHFATDLAFGRRTYNARAETVASLPSFRHAWAAGQRCIVPAECIFEPEWSTGRAVRWAIEQPGQVPMAIAGLYRSWRAPDGRELLTFAMITVNADSHPVMQRFHRPGEEKRMVALLAEEHYGAWLGGSIEEARRLLRPWPGPLSACPAPLPPRAPRAGSVRTLRPPAPDESPGGLFD